MNQLKKIKIHIYMYYREYRSICISFMRKHCSKMQLYNSNAQSTIIINIGLHKHIAG